MQKNQQLKFHFHNQNTSEEYAEYIYRIFLEANKRKFNKVLIAFMSDYSKELNHI